MHTVELLEEATAVAILSGYKIRQEWFGGSTAGACEFNGQKWIFIDLSLGLREQLDQVLGALRTLAESTEVTMSLPLRAMLEPRKAA
jgi:hypothetical protein